MPAPELWFSDGTSTYRIAPRVLDDVIDVDTSTTPPTDGQALVWNAAASLWEPAANGGTSALNDLTDVATAGAVDNDVLTYDAATSSWAPAAVPAGGSLALDDLTDVNIPTPADGQVLTWDSGTSRWVAETPAAGGGGGTGKDRRWTVGPSATSIDEFNDDTLDLAATWTRVDSAGESGFIAYNEAADCLSVETGIGTDAVAEFHGLMRPLSAVGGSLATGDAFLTCLTNWRTGNWVIGGVGFSNGVAAGAGAQVLGTFQNDGAISSRALTNWNTLGTNAVVLNVTGDMCYIRVVYLGGTSWRVDASPNGTSWVKGASFTNSITPTHVGLFSSSWGTATKGVLSFEFLRRVAGVT